MEKRGRGRPVASNIRQNIVEILSFLGKSYGYRIAKIYNEIFTPCTRENIYYNLKKGISTGEIEVESIKQEKGEYSWGNVVEKTYYKLGSKAQIKSNDLVKKYFEQKSDRNEA